jgi:CRP-like cAMP-binding protein
MKSLRARPEARRRSQTPRQNGGVSFSAGVIIFSQGDTSDASYFIESGSVQVAVKRATGRPEAVSELGPKAWFGQRGLLTGQLRSATVTTVKETVLWKLSRSAWDEFVKARLPEIL